MKEPLLMSAYLIIIFGVFFSLNLLIFVKNIYQYNIKFCKENINSIID